MKKMAFIMLLTLALLQVSCSKSGEKGNLPVKIKTEMEEHHQWNTSYSLVTNQMVKESGMTFKSHEIEFDGETFYIDKGTEVEGRFDVVDYTYEKSAINRGVGEQELYIITAKQHGEEYPTHNISITLAENAGQGMTFVTIPMVNKRNELTSVIVLYGQK